MPNPTIRKTADSPGAAGSPSEVIDALVKAALELPSGPKPDPDVATVFAMGWQVGEAHAVLAPQCFGVAESESPAQAYSPERVDGLKLAYDQITAGRHKLSRRLEAAGQHPADIDEAIEAARKDGNANGRKAALRELYSVIFGQLWAADSHLGRSFGLGRLTYAMTRLEGQDGQPESSVVTALDHYGPRIDQTVLDLASLLPTNAAHSVKNSLQLWQEAKQHLGDDNAARERLRQQGDAWSAVLSGETAAKDLLRLRDYVGSIEGLIVRLREVTRNALGALWWLVLLVGLLSAGGVALLIIDSSGTVAAGIGSLLAALGLTWKGLGGYIGRSAAKGEQALWNAQMDWTIAYRFTTVPDDALTTIPGDDGYAHLRELAKWRTRKPATGA